ncbi:MAG: serine hydrolase, partial [Gemmatimonadales bacterium]|nr:serine hydrolase [Gemmatimonadales bacterium]
MATPGYRRDRRVAICAGLAIIATTTGCSAAPDSRNSVQSAQVDSLFRSTIRPDAPGCAVGVYRSGEIVLARGYGVASIEDGRPLTSRSTFNLGSASKPFTALAAL